MEVSCNSTDDIKFAAWPIRYEAYDSQDFV